VASVRHLSEHEAGNLLLAPAPQHSRVNRGEANSALCALYDRSAKCLAGLQLNAAFNHLSISARLILLVLALALPLNLIIVGVIWDLVQRANEVQRTSLLYAARSIAAGVDAELGKYVALGEALSRSPALLRDSLEEFEAEARRAFPAGEDAWVLIADVHGQQLINTRAQPGTPLPRRNPLGIEAQQRALATGSIGVSGVLRGNVAQDWVVNIEIPIYRDGQPIRGLAVGIKHQKFLSLLSVGDIPSSWLVGFIDGQGRYIARVPQRDAQIGQYASQGWRATKDQAGLFEFLSLEGEPLINANAHPSRSDWTVGVAVKKAELQAAAWSTVRWAVMLGAGFSAASLLLAWSLARQITRPIDRLREAFADGSAEPGKPIAIGPPEFLELQDTLHRAAVERTKSNQALMAALSNLEREMRLREEAQVALAQSQRMEAIGQLAGGIAHDFNNVLAAISSYLDAITLRGTDEKTGKVIQGVMDTIQMGASLTRRLLVLSRPQGVGLERVDLNDRVTGTIELLRRTLGERVTVSLKLSPDPCPTSANPGDVDNAILNLAINARDAMPDGGSLTIETRHVALDAAAAARIAHARPGEYVVLAVSDTGHGMSPEVLKHAMEPLFTTKEPGKGTGLGLATVHGTVRHSGGFVAIDSALGKGTSVHLYFPKAEPGPIVSRATPSTKKVPLGDGELVLVVEDNDRVREATVGRLESLGYIVLEAKTGPEAVALLEAGKPVALVFSDIVMPGGMTGYDLAEWVGAMKPGLKMLLTTGYSEMPIAASEVAQKVKVLGKPCTREQLAHALREALHGRLADTPHRTHAT
jgi:signal transduction histidine kinase/ActR/RegA family two-component response regulator